MAWPWRRGVACLAAATWLTGGCGLFLAIAPSLGTLGAGTEPAAAPAQPRGPATPGGSVSGRQDSSPAAPPPGTLADPVPPAGTGGSGDGGGKAAGTPSVAAADAGKSAPPAGSQEKPQVTAETLPATAEQPAESSKPPGQAETPAPSSTTPPPAEGTPKPSDKPSESTAGGSGSASPGARPEPTATAVPTAPPGSITVEEQPAPIAGNALLDFLEDVKRENATSGPSPQPSVPIR